MIQAGNITEASWSELLRAVQSFVAGRVKDPADRDDLVQEVLLRVHRGLGGLNGQSAPGPWIYSIARNAIVDHWRRKGRAPTVPVDDVEVTGGELAVLDDDGETLQQAVAAYVAETVHSLQSPYRETLILTELQGIKYADAARQLGISLPAIKSRVLRGRGMLREALIRCCEIELGPTGRVLDCAPRGSTPCPVCAPRG